MYEWECACSRFIENCDGRMRSKIQVQLAIFIEQGDRSRHPNSSIALPIEEEQTTAELTAQGEPLEVAEPGTLRVALRPVGGHWTEVIAIAVIGPFRDAN